MGPRSPWPTRRFRVNSREVLVQVRLLVPVQTVDATPSGIKLFSKVVFMKQGRRFGCSAEQKRDVWRRWEAGQTLHEIGRAFGKDHNSIRGVVARHGGIAIEPVKRMAKPGSRPCGPSAAFFPST